jgi:O-antigen/teichoic acid export membrane protein
VEYFKGSQTLGLYSLSSNLSQMLWILPQAISIILIAYSGNTERQKSINNTNLLIRVSLVLVLTAALILAATAHFIIPFLFGNEFQGSITPFRILLIGIVPFTATTILSSFFAGSGSIRINLITSVLGFVTCLIADLLLIPVLGSIGAAIAACFGYIVGTSIIVGYYMKYTGSSIKNTFLINKDDIRLLTLKLKSISIRN